MACHDGAAPLMTCGACLDRIPPGGNAGAAFTCCGGPHHLCGDCFSSYVASCAASFLSMLPLRCYLPECGAAVPEAEVVRLLGGPGSPPFQAYERAHVRRALAAGPARAHEGEQGPPPAGEAAVQLVACRSCEAYLETAEPGYRDEARALLAAGGDDAAAGGGPRGLTGAVFECQDPRCGRRYCLACDAALPDEEGGPPHECVHDRVEELRRAILDALAEGATRRCPSCGLPGLKDLSCTHIRCERCNTRWCYACGAEPREPTFHGHNVPFDVGDPDGHRRCPIYLKYEWGEELRPRDSRFDGAPAPALRRFHAARQVALLERLRDETADEDLWNLCLERHFPGGPVDPGDVAFLGRRNEAVAALRERRAEILRLRAEEEARRRAEYERRRREAEERRREAELEAAERAEATRRRLEERREAREAHRRGLRNFILARRRAREQADALSGAPGLRPAPAHVGPAPVGPAPVGPAQ